MAEAPRVCALVPGLDNALTIGDVAAGIRALGLTVIVIDDGSTDGTGQAARDAGAEVSGRIVAATATGVVASHNPEALKSNGGAYSFSEHWGWKFLNRYQTKEDEEKVLSS